MSECPAAPPGGVDPAKLEAHPVVRAVLGLAHGPVVVLDRERQIVLAGPGLAGLLPAGAGDPVGERLGKAFACVHADEGCGFDLECAACGLARAVVETGAEGEATAFDCALPVRRSGTIDVLDLRARATRLVVDGEPFTLVAFDDGGFPRSRDALQRIFLHDLSDSLSALLVWAHLLEERPSDTERAARQVGTLARRLAADVQEQRVVLQAQAGRLAVVPVPVDAHAVLQAVRGAVEAHPAASGRTVQAALAGPPFEVTTDGELLERVLVGLLKSAAAATPRGGRVVLTAERQHDRCEWRVWEPGRLPEPSVAQEATAPGDPTRVRRLRLHAARLLVETYLHGELACVSGEGQGTTFVVRLPA